MASLLNEYNNLISDVDKIVARVVADLFAELQRKTPVDTGALRQAWEVTQKGDTWTISNNLVYASVIFDGRQIVNGKAQGSLQLIEGIVPILDKYNRVLEIELRKV